MTGMAILGALLTGTAIAWLVVGPTLISMFGNIFTAVPLWVMIIFIFMVLIIWKRK